MKYITKVDDKEYVIEIDREDEILVNGERYAVDFQQLEKRGVLSLLLNNHSYEAVVEEQDEHWDVLLLGELYEVTVQDEWAHRMAQARGAAGDASGEVTVKSPMPGIIVGVPVAVNQLVEKGETVIILESMKMENELKAPRAGKISRVSVEQGVSVEKGQPLVIITDPDGETP
jgi:biotin carboxyl carrier protein